MVCLTTLEGESWRTRSLWNAHVCTSFAFPRYIGREAEWRVAVAAGSGDFMRKGFSPPARERLLTYQAAFAQCRVGETSAVLAVSAPSTFLPANGCIIIQDLCAQTKDDPVGQSLALLAPTTATGAGDNRRRRLTTVKGTAQSPSTVLCRVST